MVLKMSETPQLGEFMQKLGGARNMAITEPLKYGHLIANMKGTPPSSELVDKYTTGNNAVETRLAALGYYYNVGTAADLAKVEGFGKDKTATPKCKEDAKDCDWKCVIQGASGEETKEISNLGDFVEYCVKPAMQKRAQGKAK